MTAVSENEEFPKWYSALLTLADHDGCQWLIASDPEYHRPSFDLGMKPEEELEHLQLTSGSGTCGCGA